MNGFPPRSVVERLRIQYPAGQRVALVSMDDPYTRLRPGDQGTVRYVDDIGTVHIAWDNGSSLGAAYGEDMIRKLPGIVKDGRWYAVTGYKCPRCGGPVYPSDIPEYTYQCFDCDEDFYSFEVNP